MTLPEGKDFPVQRKTGGSQRRREDLGGQFLGPREVESCKGEGQRLISQEGGAHSKQLMHWRVKAPQLALMMQSGREEEGPEVLMESAPTYTQGTHTPFLGHINPFKTHRCPHSTDGRAWTLMHSVHTVPNPLLAGQRSGI